MSGGPGGAGQSVVLASLWAFRWLIAVTTIAAAAMGYGLSTLQDPVYEAEARVVLSSDTAFDVLGEQASRDPSRHASNQAALMTTVPVLQRAVDQLQDGTDVSALQESIAAAPSSEADVISVTATAPTGETAARWANAVVAGYSAHVLTQVDVQRQAALAQAGPQAEAIRLRAAAYDDGIELDEKAVAPVDPAAPQPLRNAVLLGALMALVTSGLALLLWAPEDADATEASGALDAPLLGMVALDRRSTGSQPASRDARAALVALQHATGWPSRAAVVVSGLGASDSAARVVLQLGAAATAAGRSVLLVDAEGSRRLLRLSGAPAPQSPLDRLDDTGPALSAGVSRAAPAPGARTSPGVTVLSTPLTEHGAQHRALERARDAFDVVLVHSGPIVEDPDAFALLREVGDVIAVVDPGEGGTGATKVLRERLAVAGARCAGVIGVRRGGGREAVREADRDEPVNQPPRPLEDARSSSRPL